MLTISKPVSASQAQTYHVREFASQEQNYWSRDQQGHSEWQGRLAEQWGLQGGLGSEHFARLSEGQHPHTEEQLVRHQVSRTYEGKFGREATSAEHRAGWDATFSSPKSVSLTALVGGDHQVRKAHRESVRIALQELERYTQARIGNVHDPETTGKFIAATFEHDTARPVDGYAAPLRHYADTADEATRKIKRYLTGLALEIEHYSQHSAECDLSVAEMDNSYEARKDDAGNVLYIRAKTCEPGEMMWFALGVPRTPITDNTKRKLRCYEHATSSMLRMYDELEYVDELWFFDRECNIALGRIDYRWSDLLRPGLDLDALYDMGMSYYDWFKATDLPKNPHRQVVCSASPFIEIMNQWILHLKAPVFRNRYGPAEVFVGITSVHLKLPWLMQNTIDTSSLRIMVVKDDSTLVAMTETAKKCVGLESYDGNQFSMQSVLEPPVWEYKRKLVSEIFNLEHDKPEDVLSFAHKIKSEYSFTHALQGKKFRVIREEAKELGLNYVALLDQQ